MRDAFFNTEKELPPKHILGQTIQNLSPDFARQLWCDWLPAEYVKPAQAAIEKNYAANKPMVVVESAFVYLSCKQTTVPSAVRA